MLRTILLRVLFLSAACTALFLVAYRVGYWLPIVETAPERWTYALIQSGAAVLAAGLLTALALRSKMRTSEALLATTLSGYALLCADEGMFFGLRRLMVDAGVSGVAVGWLPLILEPLLYAVAGAAAVLWTTRFPRRLAPAELLAAYPDGLERLAGVHAGLLRGVRPWALYGAMGAALFATSRGSGLLDALHVTLMFVMGTSAAVLTAVQLRAHLLAEPDQQVRDRVYWIFQAVLVLVILLLLTLVVEIPVHWDPGPSGRLLTWLHAILLPTSLLAFALLLGVAVLYRGALDPRLVIRRTTLYGAAGLVFMVVLVALEELANSALASWIDLPGWTGSVGAGVVVALAFGRIQRWMEARIRTPEP